MTQSWDFSGGPPRLGETGSVTLVNGALFWVSPGDGELSGTGPYGLFSYDVRSLSRYELRLNGTALDVLTVLPDGPRRVTLVTRVPPSPGRADSTVVVVRHRELDTALHERVEVRNLGSETVACTLTLLVDTDFADLFAVKENRPAPTADRVTRLSPEQGHSIHFGYRWMGVTRDVHVTAEDLVVGGAGVLSTSVVIPPRGSYRTAFRVDLAGAPHDPITTAPLEEPPEPRAVRVDCAWTPLSSAVQTGLTDLRALQLPDPEFPERRTTAAGAPWFMTVFGRDALLTSYMALPFDRDMAVGTLHLLARLQGTKDDPITEEEPGKVLHEMRFGPEAALSLGGGTSYYGTVDATPLFVVLLEEAYRWGMDTEDLLALLPAADAALAWVQRSGDRDGDGFVDYQRATDRGLRNQGWKDSFDGVTTAAGDLAQPPIALCEVQGYVYAAHCARARIADALQDVPTAVRHRQLADDLKQRFNARFWSADGGIALALDRGGRTVDSVTSNMGHCLWSGIVDDDKAAAVVARLTGPEMSSGWGLRTLANDMAAYNPVSYHNGSVWPHDNAVVVAGLLRYGAVEEGVGVARDVLSAASHTGGRLPELWSGFDRTEFPVPVPYPTSCSPQAWAAAAPLSLLRSLLRLHADAPANRVSLAPVVPPDLLPLTVDGVRVGDRRLTITVTADGTEVDGLDGLELVPR